MIIRLSQKIKQSSSTFVILTFIMKICEGKIIKMTHIVAITTNVSLIGSNNKMAVTKTAAVTNENLKEKE